MVTSQDSGLIGCKGDLSDCNLISWVNFPSPQTAQNKTQVLFFSCLGVFL